MLGFLRWIAGFSITIVIGAFAVFNRQDITLYYTPYEHNVTLPLYMVGLAFGAAGFFVGALMVWLSSLKWFGQARTQKRTIRTLEKQMNAPPKSALTSTPSNDFFPALPKR